MPLRAGQAYNIINLATNTYIDLSGNDNRTVFGWRNNGGLNNQKWIASPAGDGWILKNAETGAYLSLANYDGGHGTAITSSRIPVVWKISSSPEDLSIVYTIGLPFSKDCLVLDLRYSSDKDGTDIIVWPPHNGPNQKWQFSPVSQCH